MSAPVIFNKKAAASCISLAATWRRRRVLFLEFQTTWLRFINFKNPHNKGIYRACAIIFAHIKKTIVCKKRVRNVYRVKQKKLALIRSPFFYFLPYFFNRSALFVPLKSRYSFPFHPGMSLPTPHQLYAFLLPNPKVLNLSWIQRFDPLSYDPVRLFRLSAYLKPK